MASSVVRVHRLPLAPPFPLFPLLPLPLPLLFIMEKLVRASMRAWSRCDPCERSYASNAVAVKVPEHTNANATNDVLSDTLNRIVVFSSSLSSNSYVSCGGK
jgi:hypothetical protein